MALISTGSEIFDQLLEGGFERDVITTIYGPGGSGKTTLCKLAALARAREKKKVIYIDTEGGFSLERLKQLSGGEFEKLLGYVMLLRPHSLEEQQTTVQRLQKLVTASIGLVIVDTLTFFYRLEMSRNEQVKETNTKLIWQLSSLADIARRMHIPVLITNQVYADFDKKDEVRMVGGDILRYNSKCLLKMSNEGGSRKTVIVSHRSIPEGRECTFKIINEGFVQI